MTRRQLPNNKTLQKYAWLLLMMVMIIVTVTTIFQSDHRKNMADGQSISSLKDSLIKKQFRYERKPDLQLLRELWDHQAKSEKLYQGDGNVKNRLQAMKEIDQQLNALMDEAN
jgi:hypothetical protein